MPIYKDPRHGVSLSEGFHEAAYTVLATRVMLNCFEFYHPIGTPDGPIYVVNNGEALLATKEDTATRDAGELVEFMAGWVRLERPEESDNAGTPELMLSVDNVSGEISDALRLVRASGSLEAWEIIERVYATDQTTGPAILPPLQMYVVDIEVNDETAQLTASMGDSVNVAIPRTTFKRSEYPGLVR